MLSKFFNLVKNQDKIGEPPWNYDFLYYLNEKEYHKYLEKIYYVKTGKKIDLTPPKGFYEAENSESFGGGDFSRFKFNFRSRLKTFNEKIQWIKLYGITPLMRICTDKVNVRDFVSDCIGAEYLKPVLQIIPNCHCERSEAIRPIENKITVDCHADTEITLSIRNDNNDDTDAPYRDNDVSTYFDQINWEKLPNAFVIKCAHGCKWHYIIRDKKDFLNNKRLFDIVKRNITGWLEQEFFPYEGFELQYKGMQPKLLIEPFMKENRLIEVYCFNGIPKVFADIHLDNGIKICTYNEDFSYADLVLKPEDKELMQNFPADKILKQSIDLSKKLSKDFRFVRVDWMCHEDKLYFEELTFTPYSGFSGFDKKWNLKMGSWINLEGV